MNFGILSNKFLYKKVNYIIELTDEWITQDYRTLNNYHQPK